MEQQISQSKGLNTSAQTTLRFSGPAGYNLQFAVIRGQQGNQLVRLVELTVSQYQGFCFVETHLSKTLRSRTNLHVKTGKYQAATSYYKNYPDVSPATPILYLVLIIP